MADLPSVGDDEDSGKNLKLFSYWSSFASCRVRIALNIKDLDYEYVAVDTINAEKAPEFLKMNLSGDVPVLVDGDNAVVNSFAILLYLEEKHPQPPLLPRSLGKKALNYEVASVICSSVLTQQNHPSIGQIQGKLGSHATATLIHHNMKNGYAALEKLLENRASKYATGDEIFLADIFLAPQICSSAAQAFNIDLNKFPLLARLKKSYEALPAFQSALPRERPKVPPRAKKVR